MFSHCSKEILSHIRNTSVNNEAIVAIKVHLGQIPRKQLWDIGLYEVYWGLFSGTILKSGEKKTCWDEGELALHCNYDIGLCWSHGELSSQMVFKMSPVELKNSWGLPPCQPVIKCRQWLLVEGNSWSRIQLWAISRQNEHAVVEIST